MKAPAAQLKKEKTKDPWSRWEETQTSHNDKGWPLELSLLHT